jgi:hypothetical protein
VVADRGTISARTLAELEARGIDPILGMHKHSSASMWSIRAMHAVQCRLLVGMLQPDRLIEQHVASRPFSDRLHLVDKHVVRSILQRQQLGDDAVFGVHT